MESQFQEISMNNNTLPQHPTSRNVTKIFSVVTTYR